MVSWRLIEKTDRLLQKEKGTIFKDPGGRVNICLVYPNTYRVGMSNLGFQGIYGILNSRHDTVCERAFLPDEEDLTEFERTGSELFSMESRRPLNRFDIIAFSVSFENDYPAIPFILALSNLKPLSSERDERSPIVMLGGVCASFNPEPIADLFDLIFIGEADRSIHSLIETFKKTSVRQEFLNAISSYAGFYVPQFYRLAYSETGELKERTHIPPAPERIRKVTEKKIDTTIRPAIVTPETEFSGMYLLEAMRGCVWSCRFCIAGHIYNPPRYKEKDILLEEIGQAREKTDRIGLVGPSLTDYKYCAEALKVKDVDFSITSLRASPRSAEILSLMKGKRSISIAPEAGTEHLRRIINKKVSEEEIIETSREILACGISSLRLYFMIGLPYERDEDIEGIISLAGKIRSLSARGNIVLSISTFVPKPFTPFQWHPMRDEKTVKRRLKMIKSQTGRNKGIRVLHDVVKYAYLQGVFSRGDRRISKAITEMRQAGRWRDIMRGKGLRIEDYLFRPRRYDELLPWDFIDIGITKESLWSEYEKARDLSLPDTGKER